MKGVSSQKTANQKLERFLAVLGTAVCLTDSIQVWQVIGKQQEMWPLPGLYLLEMAAVSGLFVWAIWSDEPTQLSLRGILSWVAVGVLVAFVILGAWSVGFLYAPVALLFIIAAILSDRREGGNLIIHLGVAFAAALAQAAMMLAVIGLL